MGAAIWGAAILSVPARAGTLNGEAAYCPMGAGSPPAPFSLPASGGDPWAVGTAACGPVSGPWTRAGPAHAWRPRRYPAAASKPKTLTLATPSHVAAGSCGIAPVARIIPMAAGPASFNVLTAGAAPNSTVTLRIDNRTTVTITVNATAPARDSCGEASYSAISTSDPEEPPKPGESELLGAGFLTALNTPGVAPFAHVGGAGIDGSSSSIPAGEARDVLEPSTLALLGSGLLGLRYLRRRRGWRRR